MAQEEKQANADFVARLERLKLQRGWTWDQMARELGITRGMIHFIKQGRYGVSARNLHRLDQLERDSESKRPGAKELLETIAETVSASRIEVDEKAFDQGYVDVPVEYARGNPPENHPTKIRLLRPDVKTCAKLMSQVLLDEDHESVLLNCIEPTKYANREFLNLMSPFSYSAVLEAALVLTFGREWQQKMQQKKKI